MGNEVLLKGVGLEGGVVLEFVMLNAFNEMMICSVNVISLEIDDKSDVINNISNNCIRVCIQMKHYQIPHCMPCQKLIERLKLSFVNLIMSQAIILLL